MLKKKNIVLGTIIPKLMFGLAGALVIVAALVFTTQPKPVQALPGDLASAVAKYPNIANSRLNTCSLCHTSAPALNPYGQAYLNAGRNTAAFAAIEALDSDGDGFTNIQEIMALTFPGNPSDFPTSPTATTVPPTATSVPPTATSVPPTATSVPPTATSVPPTATSVPPTATSVPPTATGVPPTATSVPPTATGVPPTETETQPSPSATPTEPTITEEPSETPVPPTGGLALAIDSFRVTRRVSLDSKKSITIRLDVENDSETAGTSSATVVGMQGGVEIYRHTMDLNFPAGKDELSFYFPQYTPTAQGRITWTVTLTDVSTKGMASAVTVVTVKGGVSGEDHGGGNGQGEDHNNQGEDHQGGSSGQEHDSLLPSQRTPMALLDSNLLNAILIAFRVRT